MTDQCHADTPTTLLSLLLPFASCGRGPAAAVLLCLLPILFLLVVTLVRPVLLPSGISLPLSALLLALVRLAYLSSPPLLVLAHSAVGALEGLVPLAVIFGAILLFEAMAYTGCLPFLMANVRCLSAGSPIAEVFLIGWAFAYMISGGRQVVETEGGALSGNLYTCRMLDERALICATAHQQHGPTDKCRQCYHQQYHQTPVTSTSRVAEAITASGAGADQLL